MGGAYSMYRMKGFWWGNVKERHQIDDRILLKLIVNLGLHGTDSFGFGYGHVVGERTHGDEIGFHRMWEFFA
jgi:hypothetical protein